MARSRVHAERKITVFEVIGPLKLEGQHAPPKETMQTKDARTFWQKHAAVRKRRGCYIFAMRAGKGYTPYYVGKTKHSFEREALNDRNLLNFVNPTVLQRAGTPVLFLIAEPRKRGKANHKLIRNMEDDLIKRASEANPKVLNKQNRGGPAWGIRGFLRGGSGKTSAGAKALTRCLSR